RAHSVQWAHRSPGPRTIPPRLPRLDEKNSDKVANLFVSRVSVMGSFPLAGTVNGEGRNRAVLGLGPFGGGAARVVGLVQGRKTGPNGRRATAPRRAPQVCATARLGDYRRIGTRRLTNPAGPDDVCWGCGRPLPSLEQQPASGTRLTTDLGPG